MGLPLVRTLVGHHYWSVERIVAAFGGVAPDDLDNAPLEGMGSPRAILAHMAGFEARFLPVMRGQHPPDWDEIRATFGGSVDEIVERWRPVGREMRAFLEEIDEAAMARQLQFTLAGAASAAPLADVFAQFITHAAQHRSELAALATRLGRSPGNLDVWLYLADVDRPA